ncbi:MAG TPA: hypothetical protein VLD85_09715 [Anaeromyxobacteraceae bacterium]|nr:hypothetical protein [Anaeromyxobacteraceae bacterium]
MRAMSLSEAMAAIRATPDPGRSAAMRRLVEALTQRLAAGEDFTVLDPLECTPDLGGRCPQRTRGSPVEDRVCLAWLDGDVACPHSLGPVPA